MIRPGQQLGPYKIVSLLASGGMGEVYRARDPRLERDVALKVVRSSLPVDRWEFEREARAVAALSHPNVLTVFDVGHSGGHPYLVFELLEGETLRQRLDRGALSMSRAVEVAVDVCRGLEAAHGRGLVHRDLKPRNLFLTTEGRVKILDFGLAKLRRREGDPVPEGSDDDSPSTPGDGPTRRAPPGARDADTETADGPLIGTLGYHSPEQARGLAVDARSDIFSLGAILYEMLTGRRAFSGKNSGDTLLAVLYRDPPPPARGSRPIPHAADQIVRRCLAKEPVERFSSAHDLRLALEALLDVPDAAWGPADAAEGRHPYPGLASFTEEDAPQFFGREAEVSALWRSLKTRHLVAVIGPSGVGKTSFVRAGVVASRPTGWGAVVTTPGTSPIPMLCHALVPELPADREVLWQAVRSREAGAAYDLVARWRTSHQHALLVVDHFEELFTLNPPEAQARYAELLGRLSSEAGVHVLLLMRDDFLMRCQEHAALSPVFSDLHPLGSLAGPALRRALEEPAKREEYSFEPGLRERILAEVEGERGALPLLAFAVARLWEKRDEDRRLLTHQAYQEIGEVSGALARHAEATLEQIGPERWSIVRELFRNLVTSQGTRVVMERQDLLSVFPDEETASEVLDRLVRARLLTAYETPGPKKEEGEDGSEGMAGDSIEIVHESLLTSWLRLVRWRAQDSASALLRDQLRQAARLWDERGRREDLLWTGASYLEYRAWRARYPGRLSALEEDFTGAMTALADRRRRRRRALTAAALIASLSAAVIVGVSRQREAAARGRAEASRLAALGRLELEVEPTAALALARASLALHDTPEARRLAVEALWRGPVARVAQAPAEVECAALAATADGRWLACGKWSASGPFRESGEARPGPAEVPPAQRLRIWGFADGRPSADGPPEHAVAAVWSHDGRLLDARPPTTPSPLQEDGTASVRWTRSGGWELASGTLAAARAVSWDGAEGTYQDFHPSPDRVLFSRGPSLYLRQLREGRPSGRDVLVGRHPAPVRYAAFHDPTAALVSVDENREVHIWSEETLALLHAREGLDARIFSFPSLDPSGTRLAWHSLSERATVLWDLAGPPDAGPLLMRRRDVAGDVGDAVFLGDGGWVASAAGGTVALWPATLPWPRVLRGHASPILEIAFTPDATRLVSCGGDGARVWPLLPGRGRQRLIEYERPYACNSVSIDAAGNEVLIAAPAEAGLLASLEGGPPEALVRVPPSASIRSTALDPGGRWAAVATVLAPDVEDRRLHLVDRRTGRTLSYPLPGATAGSPDSGGVYALRFLDAERLLSAGDAGLLSWVPKTGAVRPIHTSGCGTMDASEDGSRLAVGCLTAAPAEAGPARRRSSEVFVLDTETGAQRPIRTHGDAVQAVAIDSAGELIATGDTTGVVRVGRADGSEPHLLLGARGAVTSVDFSPDGRWVAGAVGREIWLWPRPDPSRRPLHTEPLPRLLATIDSLTNLRLVEDPAAPTGYRFDVGPFHGWPTSPTW